MFILSFFLLCFLEGSEDQVTLIYFTIDFIGTQGKWKGAVLYEWNDYESEGDKYILAGQD